MSKFVVSCEWDEVPHLDDDYKRQLLASYAPHERDARRKGIPSVGSGKIYPVNEDDILVEPFPIPDHYLKCYGLDPGQTRTACIWGAIDPDTGIIYLYSEYYKGQVEFIVHAAAIRSRGKWIQGAADWAGTVDDRRRVIDMYIQDYGLLLIPADKSVEAGIQRVWEYMSTGKLKVFNNLSNWLGEFRVYGRNDRGQVIKRNDHLMDATRYLVMTGLQVANSQRYAEEDEDEYFNSVGFNDGRDPITGY